MLSSLFSKKEKTSFPWNILNATSQLEEVDRISEEEPVVIFKHSTRCSISAASLGRFERSYNQEKVAFKPYFLDLISFRDVSNEISDRYDVKHESPQAILIKHGKAVTHSSHMNISYDELNEEARKL